jgi:hypothetical protein
MSDLAAAPPILRRFSIRAALDHHFLILGPDGDAVPSRPLVTPAPAQRPVALCGAGGRHLRRGVTRRGARARA